MGNNQSQQQQQQQLVYAQQMLQSYRYQQQQLSQQFAQQQHQQQQQQQQQAPKSVHLPVNEPTLILEPFLYLGGSYGNRNAPLLYYLGITHVLNMAIELPMNPDLYNNRFKVKHIAAHDTERYNIRKDFEASFQFIDDARAAGSKILVHCMMGISRSATIVIAYLMSRFGMSLPQAYSYVKGKRPEVGPNRHFMRTLVNYEQELRYPKSAMARERTDINTSRNTTPIQRNMISSSNTPLTTVPAGTARNNKKKYRNSKTNRPVSALVSESKLNYQHQRELERNQRNTPFYSSEIASSVDNYTNPIDSYKRN